MEKQIILSPNNEASFISLPYLFRDSQGVSTHYYYKIDIYIPKETLKSYLGDNSTIEELNDQFLINGEALHLDYKTIKKDYEEGGDSANVKVATFKYSPQSLTIEPSISIISKCAIPFTFYIDVNVESVSESDAYISTPYYTDKWLKFRPSGVYSEDDLTKDKRGDSYFRGNDTDIALVVDGDFINAPISKRQFNERYFPVKVVNTSSNVEDKATSNVDIHASKYEYSSLLLRTNPALTGNLKVVVDSSDNIFIDTLNPDTRIMNKNTHRHFQVSAKSSYADSIRQVFSNISKSDFYSAPKENYSIDTFQSSEKNEYDFTYTYGTSTNKSPLYKENFKIFAPLYLNKKLPDYFCIFSVDTNDIDTYNIVNQADIFNLFIKSGKVVKMFSLKDDSPIGHFLTKHINQIKDNLGEVFLQPYKSNGEVSWSGISLDSGLITTKSEINYKLRKIIDPTLRDKNTDHYIQDKIDRYITEGYRRHNIVSSNIINLEFMFDDVTSEAFKIKKYFGLYLTENVFKSYDHISTLEYSENSPKVIIDNHKELLDNEAFSNLIFTYSTSGGTFGRLYNSDSLKSAIKESIKTSGKPFLNSIAKSLNITYKEFTTLTLIQPLEISDHIRFIYNQNNEVVIIDLITTNSRGFMMSDEEYSIETILSHSRGVYGLQKYILDSDNDSYKNKLLVDKVTMYQMPLYLDSNMKIEEQVKELSKVIQVLQEVLPIGLINYKGNSISIGSNVDNTFVQRIHGFNTKENVIVYNGLDNFDTKCGIIRSSINIQEDDKNPSIYFSEVNDSLDLALGASSFNDFGDRKVETISFIKNGNLFELDIPNNVEFPKIALYKNEENEYKALNDFNVSVKYQEVIQRSQKVVEVKTSESKYLHIISPISFEKRLVCLKDSDTMKRDNEASSRLYEANALKLSLMSICDVVDLNTIGYSDNFESGLGTYENIYQFRAGDRFTIPNSLPSNKKFIITSKENKLFNNTSKVSTYSDGINLEDYYNISSLDTILEEDITFQEVTEGDTFKPNYNYIQSHIQCISLDYIKHSATNGISIESLKTPTINSWESVGTYYNGNNEQFNVSNVLMSSSDIKNITAFIPSVNLSTRYNNRTLYEYIKDGGNVNVLDKLLRGKLSRTIASYNISKDTLEFTLYGIKFTMSVQGLLKTNRFISSLKGYEVSMINDASLNYEKEGIDIFIDTNTERIVIILKNSIVNVNNLIKPLYGNFTQFTHSNSILDYTNLKHNIDPNRQTIEYNIPLLNYDDYLTKANTHLQISNGVTRCITIKDVKHKEGYVKFGRNIDIDNIFIEENKSKVCHTNIISALPKSSKGDTLSFVTFKSHYLKGLEGLNINYDYLISLFKYNKFKVLIKGGDKTDVYTDETTSSRFQMSFENSQSSKTFFNASGYYRPLLRKVIEYNTDGIKGIEKYSISDTRFLNLFINRVNIVPIFKSKHISEKVSSDDLALKSEGYNIIRSDWYNNENYFHIDTNKMFGSDAISFKNYGKNINIELSNWVINDSIFVEEKDVSSYNDNTNQYNNSRTIEIKFNITRALFNFFKNNKTFIDNFKQNIDASSIDKYIIRLVNDYFFINKNLNFELYSTEKEVVKDILVYEKPLESVLKDKYRRENNIDTLITFENGSYFYKAIIKDVGRSYYGNFRIDNIYQDVTKQTRK